MKSRGLGLALKELRICHPKICSVAYRLLRIEGTLKKSRYKKITLTFLLYLKSRNKILM
jgi:hypothetical protein